MPYEFEQRYSANINPDGWLLPEILEFISTDDNKQEENDSTDDDDQG